MNALNKLLIFASLISPSKIILFEKSKILRCASYFQLSSRLMLDILRELAVPTVSRKTECIGCYDVLLQALGKKFPKCAPSAINVCGPPTPLPWVYCEKTSNSHLITVWSIDNRKVSYSSILFGLFISYNKYLLNCLVLSFFRLLSRNCSEHYSPSL